MSVRLRPVARHAAAVLRKVGVDAPPMVPTSGKTAVEKFQRLEKQRGCPWEGTRAFVFGPFSNWALFSGVRRLDAALSSCDARCMADWHHAPQHRLLERGAYIVTAGIYQKQHLLRTARRLDLVRDTLFACAEAFRWELQAWAILSRH